MRTDMWKVKFWNKVANLDTKLVNVLWGNKAITMGVTFSSRQKPFAVYQFSISSDFTESGP